MRNLRRWLPAAVCLAAGLCCCAATPKSTPQPVEAPAFPGSVAAGPWRGDVPIPDELLATQAAHASPDIVVASVARILSAGFVDAEVHVGLLQGAERPVVYAYVVAGDDSVAGEEFRYHLVEGASGWAVERIEQRVHCRRGLSGTLCV